MAKCLNLTKSGEYAIAALSRLTQLSRKSSSGPQPISTEVLAQTQKISKSFLNKILLQCTKARIVRSKKGVGGGIVLVHPANKTSLLEIIEACEGTYIREFCVFYPKKICRGQNCPVFCPLRKEEGNLRRRLKKINLADMARSLKRHPNVT